jgi:hypothetical protein
MRPRFWVSLLLDAFASVITFFHELQFDASTVHTNACSDYSYSGVQAKISRLFELVHYIGLSLYTDRFLAEIVKVVAISSLRSLKYRARSLTKHGYLLSWTNTTILKRVRSIMLLKMR